MPMWAAILRFFMLAWQWIMKVRKHQELSTSWFNKLHNMLNTCKQQFWVRIPLACENPFCFLFLSKTVDFQNKQCYSRPIDVTNRILKSYLPTVQAKKSRLIVTPEVETSIGGSVGSSWAFRWKMWSDHRRGAGFERNRSRVRGATRVDGSKISMILWVESLVGGLLVGGSCQGLMGYVFKGAPSLRPGI